MLGRFDRLEATHPQNEFYGGLEPLMADFFADEALATLKDLLGPDHEDAPNARYPSIAICSNRIGARAPRPERFTARTDEQEAVERIRVIVGAALPTLIPDFVLRAHMQQQQEGIAC